MSDRDRAAAMGPATDESGWSYGHPLARRRPVKVARETATLDRLSGGRLTLGVGLGSDRFASEYSITGEELDDRRRASMLDESLEILAAAWSGELVHHRGEHYIVDGMRFLPRPVQRPGVPVWVAGYYGKRRPVRRAARHQGFFPLGLDHAEQPPRSWLAYGARSEAGRDPTEPYDVASPSRPATIGASRRGRQGGLVSSHGCGIGRQVRAVTRDGRRPRSTCPRGILHPHPTTVPVVGRTHALPKSSPLRGTTSRAVNWSRE